MRLTEVHASGSFKLADPHSLESSEFELSEVESSEVADIQAANWSWQSLVTFI